MDRRSIRIFRFSMLAVWAASLSLVSLSVVADEPIEIDYTCDPNFDYASPKLPGTCPEEKIQDGVCDNPNHGGEDSLCVQQDCIDCNKFCTAFDFDCFGCMNAKGCYWCPGDATCQNSDLYQSSVKVLSCTKPEDYALGGQDDPNQVCIPSDSITSDPLSLTNNWIYKMINVDKVWQMPYTGQGVSIRINDLGVDPNNSDFDGRFDQANSCDNFSPVVDAEGELDSHGTKVAGIAVANANNGHCAAGIAYGATFTSCNIESLSFQQFNTKIQSIDISQNSVEVLPCSNGKSDTSWAINGLETCPFDVPEGAGDNPCDTSVCNFANQATTGLSSECETAIRNHCLNNFRDDANACQDFINVLLFGDECNYNKLPQSAIDALAEGATEGRGGKGIIYVFASGDGYRTGEDVNFSRWPNSRYTITVGAVGKDGLHTDYSTPGAALFVVAPVGDNDDVGHIATTGLAGTCENSEVGTGYSSPVVSGVIALMLEARPELTWRDVQGILAVTSTVQSDPKDTTKTTNAASITHSDWYGFGLIDAKKAVDTALTWELLTPEYQAVGKSEEDNQSIPNDGTEYISELTIIPEYSGFTAESTVVLINLQHYNRGDLELTLVSPGGTQSILHPGRRPESTQLTGDQRWELMTVRNWGEDPVGKWQLKIRDLVDTNTVANGPNELREWKLVVYGRTADGLPPVLPSQEPSAGPSLTVASMVPSDDGANSGNISAVPSEAPSIQVDITPSPTSTPTLRPTFAPTRIPFIRPTTLVRGPAPKLPGSNTASQNRGANSGFPGPRATLPQSSSNTARVAPPGLQGLLGGTVNRPVLVVGRDPTASQQGDPRAGLVRSFTRFGDSESEDGSSIDYLSVEMVQNVSLVLEGLGEEIPRTFWKLIQTALEEHTMAVVEKKMPELRFRSEIQLISWTVNEPTPNRQRRRLRPDDLISVTVVFDELVHFEDLPEEDLTGMDLVALPFRDVEDREAFVKKIHNQLDSDAHPWLQPLVSVSPLVLPTTEEEVPFDTASVFSSENNTEKSSGDYSNIIDPASKTTTIVWSIGVALLCVTLVLVLRRRRIEGKQETQGLSQNI